MKTKQLFLLLLLALLSACTAKRIGSVNANMNILSLKANNIEETISRQDEISLTYSLSVYNKKGKLYSVVNGVWGITTMKTGDQYAKEAFQPLEVVIPEGGSIKMAVALTEIDDYEQAKKLVAQAKNIANQIRFPDIVEAVAPRVETAITLLRTTFTVAGVAVDVVGFFDNEDLVGQDLHQISASSIAKGNRYFKVPLVFKGRNFGDSYEYTLEYDLLLKDLRAKKKKEK